MKKRILAALVAVAMVFSICTLVSAEEKVVAYSQDFEGTVDATWDGLSVVADPVDPTNKVVSHTDNSWGQKLTGFFLQNCEASKVYTLKMSVYGDVAHVAISYGQNFELVDCTDGTVTQKGIVKMPYDGYNAVNVRTLANKWDTVAVKFSGATQYKFYIMTQPGGMGVNGGTVLFDDVVVYEGDVLAEVNEEIQSAVPTPAPTAEPTVAPTAAVDGTPAATVDPTATAAVTTAPTASVEPTTPVTPPPAKKVKISFKKKTYKVKKGKKVTVKITLKNAKSAKFSVDKKGKKLVKLSKKKAKSVVVKGKKKGTAKITAKAKGKKATCKVKVK